MGIRFLNGSEKMDEPNFDKWEMVVSSNISFIHKDWNPHVICSEHDSPKQMPKQCDS